MYLKKAYGTQRCILCKRNIHTTQFKKCTPHNVKFKKMIDFLLKLTSDGTEECFTSCWANLCLECVFWNYYGKNENRIRTRTMLYFNLWLYLGGLCKTKYLWNDFLDSQCRLGLWIPMKEDGKDMFVYFSELAIL